MSSARLARVQALVDLRTMLGYDAVPANYDVVGDLAYQPLQAKLEDLQTKALQDRPDYRAAALGLRPRKVRSRLAKANAKVDVNGEALYSHVSDQSSASFFVNFPIAVFNRNQGEIARTEYALTARPGDAGLDERYVLSDVTMPMRRSAATTKSSTFIFPAT